jgi:hypothetical protein
MKRKRWHNRTVVALRLPQRERSQEPQSIIVGCSPIFNGVAKHERAFAIGRGQYGRSVYAARHSPAARSVPAQQGLQRASNVFGRERLVEHGMAGEPLRQDGGAVVAGGEHERDLAILQDASSVP